MGREKYLVLADLWPDDAPGFGGGGGRGQDQLFEERKLDGGGIIGYILGRETMRFPHDTGIKQKNLIYTNLFCCARRQKVDFWAASLTRAFANCMLLAESLKGRDNLD